MNINISKEQLAYQLMENAYVCSRGRQVYYDSTQNYDLFPIDWFDNDCYEVKTEILKEAIDKKVLIVETDKYVKAFSDIVF